MSIAVLRPFDQLLLLVGTNPLPPYVVACHFINSDNPPQQVWLLYSEAGPQQTSTLRQAELLQHVLQQRFNRPVNLHPIREIGSAPAIQQDIEQLVQTLEEIQGPSSGSASVHFNYSGGTKAMALHTYRMLEQSISQRVSFSYFDGRRFRIVCDHTGLPVHSSDLRQQIQLSFKELITLHDFETYAPYQNSLDPAFLEPLKVFDQLLQTQQLSAYWGTEADMMGWGHLRDPLMKATSGINLIERAKYQRLFGRQLAKVWPDFIARRQDLIPSQAFEQVLAAFTGDYAGLLAGELPTETEDLVRFYQVLRFLDGLWLEMHTFRALSEVFQQQQLSAELCMNLELRQPGWQTYFEVDLAALIGYQLLGVSCTSYNSKAACKNKGFEIIHRVRQLGGDEIREGLKMMLVTCVQPMDRDRLQQELAITTGTGNANILVCGLEDLPLTVFKQRIADFLNYGRVDKAECLKD